jgi:hypothetical protein
MVYTLRFFSPNSFRRSLPAVSLESFGCDFPGAHVPRLAESASLCMRATGLERDENSMGSAGYDCLLPRFRSSWQCGLRRRTQQADDREGGQSCNYRERRTRAACERAVLYSWTLAAVDDASGSRHPSARGSLPSRCRGVAAVNLDEPSWGHESRRSGRGRDEMNGDEGKPQLLEGDCGVQWSSAPERVPKR